MFKLRSTSRRKRPVWTSLRRRDTRPERGLSGGRISRAVTTTGVSAVTREPVPGSRQPVRSSILLPLLRIDSGNNGSTKKDRTGVRDTDGQSGEHPEYRDCRARGPREVCQRRRPGVAGRRTCRRGADVVRADSDGRRARAGRGG